MDNLLSLIGFYELLALILPGGTAVAGAYWAVGANVHNPSAAAAIGLVGVFLIAGVLVQAGAVMWERWYWGRFGWPSDVPMLGDGTGAYSEALRKLIHQKLGPGAAHATIREQFAIARAELRRLGQDGRAETLNAQYGFARGLVTAAAFVSLVCIASALDGVHLRSNYTAAGAFAAASALAFTRFRRFGFYFADQVWRDFAALA